MNSNTRLGVSALAVIVVGGVGLAVLRSPDPGGPDGQPSATASGSPATTPSPFASASMSGLPALTETFTSAIHGFSMSYPTGWVVAREATELWTSDAIYQMSEYADVIEDGSASDTAFLAAASQALGGKSGDRWAAAYIASKPEESGCSRATEPATIGGAPGIVVAHCPDGYFEALAWVEDRGYAIMLYRVDDKAYFTDILATVKLHPEDALSAVP